MNRMATRYVAPIVVVLAAAGIARSAPTEKDKKMLQDVSTALLAVCEPVPGFVWPPNFGFIDDPGVNAYATVISRNNKLFPIVRVTNDMMEEVIQGDSNRLAYVLGHELGHLLKKHVLAKSEPDATRFIKTVFDRAQEVEADLIGAELAVKAGYSFTKGVKAILRMKELGMDYSSFEGLSTDHPSWDNRLEKMDKDKSQLWKAMSAFNNGAVFLITEQYAHAESCFERVTKEFPNCYEGWANLGFARLMQYCDQLDKADLKEYGIGQIVTGGFYFRAESIKVRGKNSKLWKEAVAALQESNRLKPGQSRVLANLGLAYLVHPESKDLKEATRLLGEADAAAKDHEIIHPVTRASMLINLGIATLADGKEKAGLARLDEGEKIVRSFSGSPVGRRMIPALDASLLYTRALALLESKKKEDRVKAADLFEQYLENCSPLSLWWGVAYDRYQDLCKSLDRKAKSSDSFKKDQPEEVRLVTGVKLKSGVNIVLTDDIDDVVKKIGKGKETIVVPSTNLRRIRYESEGVELLAGDEVLAINLVGPNAPSIPLQGRTPAAGVAGAIRIGMTSSEVEKLLGDDFSIGEITQANVFYRFFRHVGLAVRVIDNKVTEVVVVQFPSR